MTIFRIQKKENYVVLDKGFLNDVNLTWKAKGLLAYMLSLPNDWSFSIVDLATRSKCGREATGNIVKELSKAGYIHKEQGRAERGKFGKTELLVFETPNHTPLTENPSTVNPKTEEPHTENPLTENQSLLINKSLNNNLLNKNNDDEKGPVRDNPVNKPTKLTAFQFYEQNGFGALAAHVSYKLGNWIDDLSEELVIHAMKLAVENNVLRWNYVEKILQDWFNKKFKTIADVDADRLRFEAQKHQRQSFNQTKTKGSKERIPEWFEKRNEDNDEVKPTMDFEAERQKILGMLGKGPSDAK